MYSAKKTRARTRFPGRSASRLVKNCPAASKNASAVPPAEARTTSTLPTVPARGAALARSARLQEIMARVRVRPLRASPGTRPQALVGLLAVAATLAACTTHPAPPISAVDLAQARAFQKVTVYWAGRRVDGVPLTAADNLYNFVNSSVGFAMY